MSGTTDGTQRITIISRKSAVNERANICPFMRLGGWSDMGWSDYVRNGLETEDRKDPPARFVFVSRLSESAGSHGKRGENKHGTSHGIPGSKWSVETNLIRP